MSTGGGDHLRLDALRDVEVVPAPLADAVIAEVRESIRSLEEELAQLQAGEVEVGDHTEFDDMGEERLEAATALLLEQAEALVADAHAYREQRLAAARADADAIRNRGAVRTSRAPSAPIVGVDPGVLPTFERPDAAEPPWSSPAVRS